MSNLQHSNIQELIEQWYQQEQDGEQFPVDFDIAWQIAGYSRKDSAKRKLPKRFTGKLFHISVENTKGRPKEVITLSCDGLKHICLMADTEEGDLIRQYFIECEKKWKLVEKHHPKIADDIELLRLREQSEILDKQIELAKLENQKSQSDLAIVNLRYTITQTCPEHIQQKVLGYTEIKTVEYRDRIIKDDEIINNGSTVNKTWLCKRFGLLTRTGNPDTKRLNAYLAEMPSEAFQLSAYIRENQEFKREYLSMLEDLIETERQRYIGE